MSWNLSAQSCCIELNQIKTRSEFDELLNSLAQEIWRECIYDECVPDQFACDDIPSDEEQGVAFIASGLEKYIADFQCSNEGTSFIVYSEYDIQEYGDSDLADRISEFFLLNSNRQYCLSQSAAFDKTGGYAHQWITFKEGDQVRVMNTHRFIDMLFSSNHNALPFITELVNAV